MFNNSPVIDMRRFLTWSVLVCWCLECYTVSNRTCLACTVPVEGPPGLEVTSIVTKDNNNSYLVYPGWFKIISLTEVTRSLSGLGKRQCLKNTYTNHWVTLYKRGLIATFRH